MAWLPVLEPRDSFAAMADRRIAFLRRYAERAEQLWRDTGLAAQRELGIRDGEPPPALQAKVNAWMQAAELAVGTDRIGEALELFHLARGQILHWRPSHWPTIQVALLGAVLRDPQTRLTPAGIEFRLASEAFALLNWNGSAAVCQAAAGPLIASALASESTNQALTLLAASRPDDLPSQLGYLAAVNAAEARTLPLFGVARAAVGAFVPDSDLAGSQAPGALVAFLALHQRYADRLRLMSADRVRWMSLKPQASLLDWTLLLIHVALLRHGRPMPSGEFEPPLGRVDEVERQLMWFLHEAAQKLA